MPVSLIDLPPELLTGVVANIESRATLYDLARSSRQLYLFTIPHLYQSITIQEKTLKGSGQLRQLTSLLIRRPDLARHVRYFTLHTVNLAFPLNEEDDTSDSEASVYSENSSTCSESVYSEDIEGSGDLEYSEELEGSEELIEYEESEGRASPKHGKVELGGSGGLKGLGGFGGYRGSGGRVSPNHGKVDQALKTAVSAWNLPEEEENDWLRRLGRNRKCECRHDSCLALLLPALLKVEMVVLELKTWYDTHYLERMMERAARKERPFDIGQPPFEALKVFTCPYELVYKRKHRISFLACLLKLPAIQEISGGFKSNRIDSFRGEVTYCDKNPVKIDRSSSSLTSLYLAAYAVSPADFNQVLHAPKALKSLSYTVCPPARFKSAGIHHALRSQETHLESFTFDYDEDYMDCFEVVTTPNLPELDHFGPIKTFLSFNRLKVFKIAVLFLVTTENGADANKLINFFPPSLELLHLTSFEGRFKGLLEAVEHLLASKSSQHIPSLKRLILEESTAYAARRGARLKSVMWKDTKETAMERLSRLAAAQGVSFDVVYCRNSGVMPF